MCRRSQRIGRKIRFAIHDFLHSRFAAIAAVFAKGDQFWIF